MKKTKKIICGLLSALMLTSTVSPAYAYRASGNQGVASGEMDVLDGIICNLTELTEKYVEGKISGAFDEFIRGEIGVPEFLNEFLDSELYAVIDAIKLVGYLYQDFADALIACPKTIKKCYSMYVNKYEELIYAVSDEVSAAYELGMLHRGTDIDKPVIESVMYSHTLIMADEFEKTANDDVLMKLSKYRKSMLKMADSLRNYVNSLPPLETIYNIARYGGAYGEEITDVIPNVKCWIVSKSTGKNLNVYTNRSAKKLKNGDRVNVYTSSGDDTQEFCFVPNGAGYYRIRVNDGSKFIDVYNTNPNKIAKVGAKVHVWSKNTNHYRDQGFVFVKVGGYYRIQLAADGNYCLYVKNDGNVALGKVKEGSDAQLWKITYDEDEVSKLPFYSHMINHPIFGNTIRKDLGLD